MLLVLHSKANKLEIKKAVEEFYGVTVIDVNTAVVPGKNKSTLYKSWFYHQVASLL